MERERYHPINELKNVYQKEGKSLIVSEKEFTFQTNTEIFKRKRPMKELEPRTENKLPICGGCQKIVEINNPNKGYLRYKDELFHSSGCFEKRNRTPQEIIFREGKIKEES